EVLPDRGERNSDDRDVEDDHQGRQTQDVEGEPAGSGVEVAHRLLVPFVRFRSLGRENVGELIGRPADEFWLHGRSVQNRMPAFVLDLDGVPATAATVDGLARLALSLKRRGRRLRVRRASTDLVELIGLMGLAEVLGLETGR